MRVFPAGCQPQPVATVVVMRYDPPPPPPSPPTPAITQLAALLEAADEDTAPMAANPSDATFVAVADTGPSPPPPSPTPDLNMHPNTGELDQEPKDEPPRLC